MRFLILGIAVIIAVAIQATLRVIFNLPWQVTPDLILIMVISYGLLRGPKEGIIFGVIAGLFMDLNSGGLVGVSALSKMLAGFCAGLLEKTIFKDSLLIPALASGIGTLVFSFFEIIMHLTFDANFHLGYSFLSIVLPLALYNAIFAPGVYFFLLKLEHFLSQRDSKF